MVSHPFCTWHPGIKSISWSGSDYCFSFLNCIFPCLSLNTASQREFAPDLSFPQQSHQSLHLPCWVILEDPEGLKPQPQKETDRECLVFICIYSVHLMTEVFITLQTTQNIWKVQKHGTKKWWFPKGISTSICPFSGSIFVLGVSILQRGQLKISGAAWSQQKSRRVPSSVPIWRARIAISEDASWFLDEYGPGTPGDFRTPLEIALPVELFPEDFPKVMCLEGCNILKSHLVSPGN